MTHHRYHIVHDEDADYIVWGSWSPAGNWTEYTRWMIPGTWIETP